MDDSEKSRLTVTNIPGDEANIETVTERLRGELRTNLRKASDAARRMVEERERP